MAKRYDKGGKVEDDVGSVSADADRKSIAQGERDFGRNNSNIRNRVGTRSGESSVSPMIQIYPNIGKQRLDPLTEEGASQENLDANRRQRKGQLGYAKGGKVIKSESY